MLTTIGDINGVVKSTVSKIIENVSHNIALMREHFIFLPRTEEEIKTTSNQFFEVAKFPNVICAIDCTHVKISSPGLK